MLSKLIQRLPVAMLAVGLLFALTAASAVAAPSRTTLQATEVDTTFAKLNGTISAEGHSTDYYFAYGTASNPADWNLYTPMKNTESATTIEVTSKVTGLSMGTTYYFGLATRDNVTGEIQLGGVRSFTTLSASHPMQFLAAEYPVTISGKNAATYQFSVPGFQVKCGTANLNASLSAPTAALAVTPQLASCTTAFGATTVKLNSCHYSFILADEVGGPRGVPAIECSKEGDAIEYVAEIGCTVRVPAQTPPFEPLVSLFFQNEGPATARTVGVYLGTSKLNWTSTGFWCPYNGVAESGENGSLSFESHLKATNGKGAQTELYVSKG